VLIVRRRDVLQVLDGAEDAVRGTVREAYLAHARQETSVPHSVFVRFPGDTHNRVIALPAFVGGTRPAVGVKWVASFPGNVNQGRERASAAIVLSSVLDGRPLALVEGAVISARRTAASAALAAAELTAGAPDEVGEGVSLIGCGVINFEVLRFLRTVLPRLSRVALFDTDQQRAQAFAARVARQWTDLKVELCAGAEEALGCHRVVALATTAIHPHLSTAACRPGTVVLHVSLRDLTPESIAAARNVVDDADHVCRAATSLELAERLVGDRRFITAEIGEVLSGRVAVRYDPYAVTVFSPFGLGALDTALAAYVLDAATGLGLGVQVPDFLSEES
jgi:N-[(2S)-2-amino-2-carboxyethyl]-L-glutamate dehydrogenase